MSDKMTKDHLADVLNELGCERPEATYAVQRHIAALEQHVSDLEKSLEDARKGRDDAVSHLANVTEVLVGERPVGMMPGTALEAARALVSDRDVALADNAALLPFVQEQALVACEEATDTASRCGGCASCEARRLVAGPHPGVSLIDEVPRLRVEVATGGEEWLELQQALGFPDDGMIRSVLDVRDAVVGRAEELVRLRECAQIASAHGAACATAHMAEAEQHRKALVRARNEGLEKVRVEVERQASEYGAMRSGTAKDRELLLSDLANDVVALKEPEQ